MQLSHPMVEMRERAFEQAECARYERRALLHANGTAVREGDKWSDDDCPDLHESWCTVDAVCSSLAVSRSSESSLAQTLPRVNAA
jgi:hypothetical protein